METLDPDHGKESHPLTRAGINGKYNYQFFQLVSLLEKVNPKSAPIAEGYDPSAEVVRFNGNFNLGFPAGDIQQITPGEKGENPVQATINFLGLGGAFGPLPMPYNQLILERYYQKDRAILQFMNNFVHRLISLFYRVKKHFRPAVDGTSVETESYSRRAFSILGLHNKTLKNKMSIPDRSIMGFSSVFLSGSRSLNGLETLLKGYFTAKIRIEPFCGSWENIEERLWTTIGFSGINNVLGKSFLLGTRAWLDQSRFTVHVGPLDRPKFMDFLPSGTAYTQACDLIKFYAGDEFDFNLSLELIQEEVPGTRLGERNDDQPDVDFDTVTTPQLGWNFILRTQKETPDQIPKTTITNSLPLLKTTSQHNIK